MPRKIRIRSDEAEVRTLGRSAKKRFKGHPELVRRVSYKKHMPGHSLAKSIAWLLYPEHFPKPVASGTDRRTGYTERVVLDSQSQKGIEGWYDGNFIAYKNHNARVITNASLKQEEILDESGISANSIPMNVGVTKKGKLMFFEVVKIFPGKLEKKILAMPEATGQESLRKKQALELLQGIKKIAGGKKEIWVE